MKKIFLTLLFLVNLVDAKNINECKIDFYYATDVILPEDEAGAEELWVIQSFELLEKYPQIQKQIGDTKVAYNLSDGLVSDYLVNIQENTYAGIGWTAFKILAAKYLKKAGGVLTGGE